MLKKFLSQLPEEYDYRKSEWYNQLASDIILNIRRMVLISIVCASLIPASFLIIDLSAGETNFIMNYAIPLSGLMILFFYVWHFGTTSYVVTIIIIIAFAGFFLAAYLPKSSRLGLFIMVAFVPFVFQLKGLRKGTFWALFFFAGVTVNYTLCAFSIVPEWNLNFSQYHLIMIALGIIISFILIFSVQMQYEKHLINMIKNLVFDSATGLPNKNTMIDCLPEHKGFILAIVRIQNFSELSSLFGYELVEKILLFVAKIMDDISRRDGYTCFKLLGHEFGIMIHEDAEILRGRGAEDFLNVLWFELQSVKLVERNHEFRPTYRIGAAKISADQTSDALSKADIALNMADKLLHNVYIYNELSDDRKHVIESSELYSVLLDNIKNNLLKTVYQPIVDTFTGEVSWYEALLRVQKKDGTYESIFNYLPVARNTGLYNQITNFVLNSAHNFIKTTGHDVSVNITLGDIIHPGFMEEVIRICEDIRHREGNLIIEILESEELIEIDLSRKFIQSVQALGCKVAVDDFGSGYSNFSTLLNLSIDIVKIDGMLMKLVEDDKNALSMIESIADFCHKAEKKIVAEYIESEYMHSIAMNNNIHFCQGYYFGKPESLIIPVC